MHRPVLWYLALLLLFTTAAGIAVSLVLQPSGSANGGSEPMRYLVNRQFLDLAIPDATVGDDVSSLDEERLVDNGGYAR